MKYELLERALEIATKAHKGQVDKSGAVYIFHPIRVAERCTTEEEKIVALLHDTIEDTSVTPEYLSEQGFPRTVVDAVIVLHAEMTRPMKSSSAVPVSIPSPSR